MTSHGTTAALACLLWLGSAIGVVASPADADSPPVIALRGVLESRKSEVPASDKAPQKDRKVVVHVLKLPMPVPARGLALPVGPGELGTGFKELQLI